MAKGPVVIDLDDTEPVADVSTAPPVPEIAPPQGQAMQTAARLAARKPSVLSKWFWGLLLTIIGATVSVAAWDFATRLVERAPVLGWIVTGLFGAFVLVAVIIAIREIAAIGRLSHVDSLRRAADSALADDDLTQARAVTNRLIAFYNGRDETQWGRERLTERMAEQFDASALLTLAEDELLAPLDAAASREVEAAARQVAMVTALVPLALADVVTAFAASLRMIRRIAEIYGGRAGFLGSWRLTRAVFVHLVATGAVAVGDDLLEPVLGGSILSKLSRRFGEGLVNGALSARVGVAAMEVCRPLPFSKRHRPSTRGMVKRALSGLFAKG
ncbi:MAG: YcjF family protein [Ruegeria sp.]